MSQRSKAPRTAGYRLLRRVHAGGVSQSEIARVASVRQPSVWAWLYLHARPTHAKRIALRRAYGIPEDAWLTAAERAATGACPRMVARAPRGGGSNA